MKTYLILSLVVMSGVLSASKKPFVCENNNAFIKRYAKAGVHINSQPVHTSEHCGTEWKTHGSCCNEKSITEFIAKEKRAMSSMIHGTYSEMKKAVRSIKSDLRQRSKEEKIQKATWYTEFKKLLKKIKEHLSSESRKQHKENHMTCQETLATFRANSACDICSANAAHFFRDGQKLKLSEDKCRDLITKCRPSWQETSKLVKRMNILMKFSEKTAATSNTAVLDNTMSDILKTWTEDSKMNKFLKNCVSPADHAACTEEDASFICRKMLRISGNSFVDPATEEKLKEKSGGLKKSASGRRLQESWDYSTPETEEEFSIVDAGLCEDPSYGCASENNWAS